MGSWFAVHIHDEEAARRMIARNSATPGPHPGHTQLQRQLLDLQRSAGNAAVSAAVDEQPAERHSPVLDVVGRGGGTALPAPVRADMESRFGADFADVRMHTGEQAASSAASVQARAYTVGEEIVLGTGREDVNSSEGQHTLAHELTHVLQQRAGAVDGTATGDGISVSDPSDRFEQAAEANATSVLAKPAMPAPVGATQRQVASEEEAPMQAQSVQRAGVEEEQPEEEPQP